MREKIVDIVVSPDLTPNEQAGQILTLLREEIEKVENRYLGRGERRDRAKAFGFETCRQKILALLSRPIEEIG